MQTDLSSLKSNIIDKNTLENKLTGQKEQYLKEIRELEAEINWLKNKIKSLEGRVTSAQSTPQKPAEPEPKKSVGEIIEQDIK